MVGFCAVGDNLGASVQVYPSTQTSRPSPWQLQPCSAPFNKSLAALLASERATVGYL